MWQSRAACLGAGLEVFFGDGGERYEEARRLCAVCEVLLECRRANDRAERGQPRSLLFGVFAAETPVERYRRRYDRSTV